MQKFDDAARQFMTALKIVDRKIRWFKKGHPDYVEGRVAIRVPGRNFLRGEIRIVSHKLRDPKKYSFSVIFRGERLLGLDVEPGRTHYNITDLELVSGTHWQEWPNTDAVPDSRSLGYCRWLDEFLEQATISYPFPCKPPPFGEQLGLEL